MPLPATAFVLAAVPVGAFDDAKAADVLALSASEAPVYIKLRSDGAADRRRQS